MKYNGKINLLENIEKKTTFFLFVPHWLLDNMR